MSPDGGFPDFLPKTRILVASHLVDFALWAGKHTLPAACHARNIQHSDLHRSSALPFNAEVTGAGASAEGTKSATLLASG